MSRVQLHTQQLDAAAQQLVALQNTTAEHEVTLIRHDQLIGIVPAKPLPVGPNVRPAFSTYM